MSSNNILPARTLRSADDLVSAGLIPETARDDAARVAARYAVALTPTIASLINPDDPNDPIARQFLPNPAELDTLPQELTDPIGDEAFSPVKGIVHRYPDRVLLKPILVCPVYCRFCFRRETVGSGEGTLAEADLMAAFGYIIDHPEIWEVVVTGGDPLMLAAPRLNSLIDRLAEIPHVKVIRFHSRIPVTDPPRINDDMVAALGRSRPIVYLGLHANHPREFSEAARAALAKLRRGGVPMVGQSVLLKGINDNPDTLAELMRAYVENGVKPYYLHHGDLAPGTAHLRTTLAEGRDLMKALRGNISGLCQPAYVLDIPGGHGKAPVGPNYLHADTGEVEDWRGKRHRYEFD
jgi:lysine 2,3-aminomutase